jgi:hypothetical protein
MYTQQVPIERQITHTYTHTYTHTHTHTPHTHTADRGKHKYKQANLKTGRYTCKHSYQHIARKEGTCRDTTPELHTNSNNTQRDRNNQADLQNLTNTSPATRHPYLAPASCPHTLTAQ